MKQNRYFKGQDLRAIESPYEAAFELADRFHEIARILRVLILVLIGIFIYYAIGIIGIIMFNILYGTAWALNLFGVIFSLLLLAVLMYVLFMLFRSDRFLKDLRAHHSLLLKIEALDVQAVGNGHGIESAVLKNQPKKGVMGLIFNASEHSQALNKIFNLIIGFILLWYFAGILFFAIQTYRFGADLLLWQFDWLIPGGVDLFLTVSATILIFVVRTAFDFVRERYRAIEYAMDLPPVKLPAGATPIARYRTFISAQKGYEELANEALWKGDDYFDATILLKRGWVVIKTFELPPSRVDLQEFRTQVLRCCGKRPLDRAIIVHPENAAEQLPDEVYTEVIEEPIRCGKDVCSIQLVMEGLDGTYDLIPVVA